MKVTLIDQKLDLKWIGIASFTNVDIFYYATRSPDEFRDYYRVMLSTRVFNESVFK